MPIFCIIYIVAANFYTLSSNAKESESDVKTTDPHRLSRHIGAQVPHSLKRILDNFVGADHILFDGENDLRGLPGAIIAAPSVVHDLERGETQNYAWRWKRDAAIVMRTLVRIMMKGELEKIDAHRKLAFVRSYVEFCEKEQLAHFKDGHFELGHAKVSLQAEVNALPWGYPQNDGPPLESMALFEILNLMKQDGLKDIPLQQLILRVLKRNLDYMLAHYGEPAVERWEEVKARAHFSILAETQAALRGAQKAIDLFDPSLKAGDQIDQVLIEKAQAHLGEILAYQFAGADRQYIPSHLDLIPDGSLERAKNSALDMQVLMTSVAINKYWEMSLEEKLANENFIYPPSHPLMRATFYRLSHAFYSKYSVNRLGIDHETQLGLPGLLFGRYPEDSKHFRGAPWFITTFAAVQFLLWDAIYLQNHELSISNRDQDYFRSLNSGLTEAQLAVGRYEKESEVSSKIRKALVKLAKDIFFRAMVHTGSDDFTLTEVLDPDTGYKTGIEHLTWSYVEYLKSVRMFARAKDQFGIKIEFDVPNRSLCSISLAKSQAKPKPE